MIGCSKKAESTTFFRTWKISKSGNNYSLVIEIHNQTNKSYYINNWSLLSKTGVYNECGFDIKNDYFLSEMRIIHADSVLLSSYNQNRESDGIERYEDVFNEPNSVNKEFIKLALKSDLDKNKSLNTVDKEVVYLHGIGTFNIYSRHVLLEPRSVFMDSLFVNTIIFSQKPITIVFNYNITESEFCGCIQFVNKNDSIFISGLPLKKVGKYILYDKEFTDTIILQDGKIEVKYGN